MTEVVIGISVVTMVAVAIIGFVVQHHIDRHDSEADASAEPETPDTGAVELPDPGV